MDYATFVTTVARLARTDRVGSERAIRATLQTLAEHLTREEARQVAGLLPGEFVRRVAEREGVDLEQAAAHTRAVFTTLREVIPDKELRDITDQLPREYDALLLGR